MAKSALQWAASNAPLVVLALILAVLTWIVALEEEDPTDEERFSQPIPITVRGRSEDMVIVGEFDERVQITVRAPRSVLDSLEIDDCVATVDLAGKEAGIHKVPVKVVLKKKPSDVRHIEPEYVTLELEPRAERLVPVHIEVGGEPAPGYLTQTSAITPTQTTASGPGSYVTQVVEALAWVSVQGASTDIGGELPLKPLDGKGQPVPNVTLAPAVAHVHVPIQQSSDHRALPVSPIQRGQIASGYRITGISVEPPTVNVRGAPYVLDALPGYIETEPIDVEGARTDVVVQPMLEVPPGITLTPPEQHVTVTVSIKAIQGSLTMKVVPELQSLEPGLTATISLASVEVILGGPLPLLETLESGDVHVILNLFEKQRGTHQIKPQVIKAEELVVLSINPATVQVEILTAPTPTPPD